jgi:hypothetical protein
MIAYTDGLVQKNKAVEAHNGLKSPDLLHILEAREREIQEKSLLIEELKKALAEIKENPARMLEEERKKRQSENIHTLLNTKQLELFKILRKEERSYNEIFEIASSKKLAIRDMHALRLQLSRLDQKLKKETNFKIARIRRDRVLYFTIASD